MIALDLFSRQGFEETTVEEIAAEAGVSSRTYFRYFETKASVLWHQFDEEVEALSAAFAEVDPAVPMMEAIRRVVVGVNHYCAEDLPELRTRMQLVGTVPALAAEAAVRYDAWERTVSEFAAARLHQSPTDLVPLVVGRATLASCRSAFDYWVAVADSDLPTHLEAAVRALASGFREV